MKKYYPVVQLLRLSLPVGILELLVNQLRAQLILELVAVNQVHVVSHQKWDNFKVKGQERDREVNQVKFQTSIVMDWSLNWHPNLALKS